MEILITGVAGYIGSVLTQRLIQEGNQVRALDNLMWGGKSLLPVWHCNDFEFIKGIKEIESLIRNGIISDFRDPAYTN
jgi:nucleoside-diphosphate-sugar epimerase